MNALPGSNCGACGKAGCAGFAEALKKGEAMPLGCVVNNEEARIIATKYLPITENVALKMKIMDFAVGKNMNIENVQKYADILFQEGELNTRIDVFKILYTGG